MRKLLVYLGSLALLFQVQADNGDFKTEALKNINFIDHVFQANYAPKEWKQSFSGWTLKGEIESAKAKIEKLEGAPLRDYQKVLTEFFNSTKDYHVAVRFYSTESAQLPFQVKGVGERYFLAYINREKLPEKKFPFAVGDELISFGGESTHEVVSRLQATLGGNTQETDRALAEMRLTYRSRRSAMDVPRGPITIEVKPKEAETTKFYQMIWDYTEEQIYSGNKSEEALEEPSEIIKPLWTQREMIYTNWDQFQAEDAQENPHQIGGKKSFIPALGTKIWESTKESLFHAYIYTDDQGRLIGYVRIPRYTVPDYNASIKEFAEVIKKFESSTEALVIDQVNNPGGSVFYLYALASILTDKPLTTPKHRMIVTQKEAMNVAGNLPQIESIKTDEEAKKLFGETIAGYPVSYEVARFFLEYSRFLLDQYHEGHALTDPYFLGIDHINPYPEAQYTKPILLLTNSLDFSGGDFFPAILQDNNRVTILGTRTAGAGGYVHRIEYPNSLGVQLFTTTASIAERVDQNPIENLGVTPDIPVSLTAKDLQENYVDYVGSVKEAVNNLIKK